MTLSNRPSPADEYRLAMEKKLRAEMRSQLLNSGGQLHDLVCETLCRERCTQEQRASCFNTEAVEQWKPCPLCHGQAKAVIAVVRSTLLA